MGGIRRKQLNKKAPKGAYLLELKTYHATYSILNILLSSCCYYNRFFKTSLLCAEIIKHLHKHQQLHLLKKDRATYFLSFTFGLRLNKCTAWFVILPN